MGSMSIKQEAQPRPILNLPWELSFQLEIVDNQLINETKLMNWFKSGGLLIGLGGYRPKYGRFMVKRFEI